MKMNGLYLITKKKKKKNGLYLRDFTEFDDHLSSILRLTKVSFVSTKLLGDYLGLY